MARQRPPDYLPREVLMREDFAVACACRDLGELLRIAIKWGCAGFTASHIARRCDMTISQITDYARRGRRALSIDVFERVADGLAIPGRMLGIGDRPWESSPATARPLPDRHARPPWTAEGTLVAALEVSEVDPVERRSFLMLTGAALTSPAHEWLIRECRYTDPTWRRLHGTLGGLLRLAGPATTAMATRRGRSVSGWRRCVARIRPGTPGWVPTCSAS
jgi:hypothetical protein